MAHKRKSWQEKLHNGSTHKVEITDKKFADIPEGATMLVPTPEIVNTYISNIPTGHSVTLQQMRKDLAATYHAAYCCPITSGIFVRIAAEAAYEAHINGSQLADITPFWRIIDRKSPALKKLSSGPDFVMEQREREGLAP